MFGNVHQVGCGAARDSELEDYLLYWSSHDGGLRKELFKEYRLPAWVIPDQKLIILLPWPNSLQMDHKKQ